MCAEREPLDCHRCLLVARALAERGLTIGHILHDGTVEPHAATEQRLLALTGASDDLFVTGQDERLAAAYRRRARAVAYRANGGGEVRRGDEMMLAPLRALAVLLLLGAGSALAQDAGTQNRAASTVDTTPPGTLEKVPLPPLANPDCPEHAGEGIVRPQADTARRPGARHRRLCQGLPRRRRGAADHGPDLAGDAAVAQSQLGQPGADRFHRAVWRERQEGRLERASGRRHGAAARRPDADRPCQPPDRARCRYLVHADARPRAQPRGARDDRRRQHGRAERARRRSQGVDARVAPR